MDINPHIIEAQNILTKLNNLKAKDSNDAAKIEANMRLYEDLSNRCYPALKYINSHITLTYEGYLDYNSEMKFEEAKGALENYIKKETTPNVPKNNEPPKSTNPSRRDTPKKHPIKKFLEYFLAACTIISAFIGIHQCANEDKPNINNSDESKTKSIQQQQDFEYDIKNLTTYNR